MLPRLPLRYILATTGAVNDYDRTVSQRIAVRGDLKRCMIVTPGNLVEQWQDELYRKFNALEILTNDRIESAVSGNVFTEVNLASSV